MTIMYFLPVSADRMKKELQYWVSSWSKIHYTLPLKQVVKAMKW